MDGITDLAHNLSPCYEAEPSQFSLTEDGQFFWQNELIGQLERSDRLLYPKIAPKISPNCPDKAQESSDRAAVPDSAQRAEFWQAKLNQYLEHFLKPLYNLDQADFLAEKSNFIREQLLASLGIKARLEINKKLRELDAISKAALRRLGVRFGVFHIYLPALIRPQAAQALIALWRLFYNNYQDESFRPIISALRFGRTSFPISEIIAKEPQSFAAQPRPNKADEAPASKPAAEDKAAIAYRQQENSQINSQIFYNLAGYVVLGERAVRVDSLERLQESMRAQRDYAEKIAAPEMWRKIFVISANMLSYLGISLYDIKLLLCELGYKSKNYDKFLALKYLGVLLKPDVKIAPAEPVGNFAAQALEDLAARGGFYAKEETEFWYYAPQHFAKNSFKPYENQHKGDKKRYNRRGALGAKNNKASHKSSKESYKEKAPFSKNKAKSRYESGQNAQFKPEQKNQAASKPYHKAHKPGHKPHKKLYDPKKSDSPFAVLAGLRSKLRSN